MFVGHFAVALAAKRVTPRLSLPLLFAAVQFLDILWPIFIVLGIEHARIVPGITEASPLDLYDMPYSHSLLMSVVWSILAGVALWTRPRRRAAPPVVPAASPTVTVGRGAESLVLAICVFSHFVLDFVTHRPDLPLAPGSQVRFGLGLWNARTIEVVVEASMFLAGILIYVRGTRASREKKMGSVGLVVFMLILALIWLGSVFGPPPPNIQVVAWSIIVSTPVILWWAYAVDRARLVAQ